MDNGVVGGAPCDDTDADRVCIPVPVYHCFGMTMAESRLHDARRHDGHPGAGLRPSGDARRRAREHCTSLYGVPTMFIAELAEPGFDEYDLTSLRTGIMAGSPCPVEIMKQVVERMGMEEVTICYAHDRDLPCSAT